MATYVSNRNSGGLTDEEGHYKFWNSTFIGNVLQGQQVVQNSTPNLNVRVSAGIIRIPYDDYAYQAWSEGYTLVPISTPDVSNPRIDRVVAYIDRSMVMTDTDINNPGMLKYKAVAGTPNAVPSAPNDSAVTSSVGATNPWVELARVAVSASDTDIITANITDTRTFVSLSTGVLAPHIGAPTGTIYDFAGTTAPTGHLMCYGQAISRTDYASLFSVIGTTYGVGDGSTTFNLPDCRGRVTAGKDNMGGTSADNLTLADATNGIDGDVLGAKGGKERHQLTTFELASHAHGVYDPGHVHGMYNTYNTGGPLNRANLANSNLVSFSNPNTGGSGTGIGIYAEGGNGPHNNVQPTIIFNKIIKT